ncbi:MAG: hypothetical protein MJ158_04030 [Alphaproteobacteria bacterium]|nr:hypothetical protein [Alphaproteobacteria bacterium]
MNEDGCLNDQEQTDSVGKKKKKNSATTLFQQVLADVEKEAQAKYNAKLTKEQNVCLANNNGGIQGVADNGSTFMWVKLKSKKTPGNYSTKGLTDKQIVASNDLYGSFCRARIHILSDDKQIQDALGDDSYAYFAVGDAFTCGSWISQDRLDKITEKVGEKARKEAGEGSQKEKMTYAWSVIGGLLGGGAIGTGLSESGAISGLLNKADTKMGMNKTNEDRKKECAKFVKNARSAVDTNSVSSANSYAKSALKSCRDLAGKDSCPSEEVAWYTDSAAVVDGSTVDGFNKAISNIKYVCNGYINESPANAAKDNAKTSCLNSITMAENSANTPEIRSNELVKASAQCKIIDPNNTMCAAVAYSEGTVTTAAKTNNKEAFLSYISEIESGCDEASDVSAADAKRNKAIRIAVPLATAAAGGALGAGISASVLKAKYEKAENEAIAEWMEKVGEHIKCYLGSEELGSYGDVVTFDIN